MSDVESKLVFILNTTNEWLKFAEAKNAGLFAVAGAAGGGVLEFVVPTAPYGSAGAPLLYTAFVLLAASALIALCSFIPNTDLRLVLGKRGYGRVASTDNLYFYGHSCKYEPDDLARAIANRYLEDTDYDPVANRSDVDLAAQVVANSRIAITKYYVFGVAARLAFWGVVAAILGVIVPVALPPLLRLL